MTQRRKTNQQQEPEQKKTRKEIKRKIITR